MFRVTARVHRLIQAAETILESSKRQVLTPVDLFMGGLYERTGVLGDLYLLGRFALNKLHDATLSVQVLEPGMNVHPFQVKVSPEVRTILARAQKSARRTIKFLLTKATSFVPFLRFPKWNHYFIFPIRT